MNMAIATQIATADFGEENMRLLANRAISFMGITSIPDLASPRPHANAKRGYEINNNGKEDILNFDQIMAFLA